MVSNSSIMRMQAIPENSLQLVDVTNGNTARLDDLLALYSEAFPDYQHYLPTMQRRARLSQNANPRFVDHQWLVEIHGQTAGLMVFKYLVQRNFGFLLDLYVDPEFRQFRLASYSRLARALIERCIQQLTVDATAQGKTAPLGLIVEAKYPRLVTRYIEYGFVELPVDYYEPPTVMNHPWGQTHDQLNPDDFNRMHLLVRPIQANYSAPLDLASAQEIVLACLVDHYRLPREHWAVQQVIDSYRP